MFIDLDHAALGEAPQLVLPPAVAPLPEGPFGFVMSDPPWRFATYSAKGKEQKSAEAHYATMTLADIKAIPVAAACEKDCWLWLWATRPMVREAFDVMSAWGFTYSTMGFWRKRTKHGKPAFGTGYVLRDDAEPFIIAKRGKPKVYSRSVRSTVEGVVREHSRKPEEAYAAADLLAGPVAKLDMFARQGRPTWTAWGNEAAKFDAPSLVPTLEELTA
jgi:N6-adenosine-specific RNA methylase IME4